MSTSEQVAASQQARRRGGEEPIRPSYVWVESIHVENEADRRRVMREANAAVKQALKQYVRQRR